MKIRSRLSNMVLDSAAAVKVCEELNLGVAPTFKQQELDAQKLIELLNAADGLVTAWEHREAYIRQTLGNIPLLEQYQSLKEVIEGLREEQ